MMLATTLALPPMGCRARSVPMSSLLWQVRPWQGPGAGAGRPCGAAACTQPAPLLTAPCPSPGSSHPVFITFKVEPERTTVYQGHTALLRCEAQGDPKPLIQWKGKDRILDPTKLEPR